MRYLRTASPTASVFATAVILLCSYFSWTKPSAAIENLKVVRGVLILEGKIEPGDYISVRNFLSDASNSKKMNGEIFLGSQGGNVIEAVRIGYLIRHLQLSTNVPSRPPWTGSELIHASDLAKPSKNYRCTSACFLLYVAGIHRDFIRTGLLGLHQPQIERKPIGATEADISAATADVREKLKTYFEQMNVPNKYLDLMYSMPPNRVRWITQNEFDADLEGYIPEFRALLDSKCDSRLEAEHSNELVECVARVKTELRTEAWRKILHRD